MSNPVDDKKHVSDCCRKPVTHINLCTLCYEWCYLLCAQCFAPHTLNETNCTKCEMSSNKLSEEKNIREAVLDVLGRASKE